MAKDPHHQKPVDRKKGVRTSEVWTGIYMAKLWETLEDLPRGCRADYISLLCHGYMTGSITANLGRLAGICGVDRKTFARSWQILEPKFILCEDGRYRNRKQLELEGAAGAEFAPRAGALRERDREKETPSGGGGGGGDSLPLSEEPDGEDAGDSKPQASEPLTALDRLEARWRDEDRRDPPCDRDEELARYVWREQIRKRHYAKPVPTQGGEKSPPPKPVEEDSQETSTAQVGHQKIEVRRRSLQTDRDGQGLTFEQKRQEALRSVRKCKDAKTPEKLKGAER